MSGNKYQESRSGPSRGEAVKEPVAFEGKLVRWADRAQYHSEAMPEDTRAPGGGNRPKVTLLNATPDPLGSLAALCGIYEGKVVRRLSDVTNEDRRAAWEAMQATVLNGPLESIQFHFLVEGVTRAFTHQAVRNRFSFFAQESMRFAVVDDEQWVERQAYPPSLAAEPYVDETSSFDEVEYMNKRRAWDRAIEQVQGAYLDLIARGVPAEEARGLMPHSMTTRYHWIVNIRALLAEAGKRLCTQAQFEWRLVMAEVVKALRGYESPASWISDGTRGQAGWDDDHWQFELMASALQPVCYQEGHCGFMAKFDRGCTIRERVNANAAIGRPSSEWGERKEIYRPVGDHREMLLTGVIEPIMSREWLADPGAART